MDCAVVVHAGLDASGPQPVRHPRAVLEPRGKEVVDGRALRALGHDPDALWQQLAVVGSAGAPGLVPLVQVLELDAQQRGLQAVEAVVEAQLDVLALDALAEIRDAAYADGKYAAAAQAEGLRARAGGIGSTKVELAGVNGRPLFGLPDCFKSQEEFAQVLAEALKSI